MRTLAHASELLSRLTASKGDCHTGHMQYMHAFKARMKRNYDGQRSMLCIGADLNLGDELDSPVILEQKHPLGTSLYKYTASYNIFE